MLMLAESPTCTSTRLCFSSHTHTHTHTHIAYVFDRCHTISVLQIVASGLDAVVVKVASIGLDPKKHLGKSLGSLQPTLRALNARYGVHVCGEGGEYESLVLDCVLYKRRIVIDASEIVLSVDDPTVGHLRVLSAHLDDKSLDGMCCGHEAAAEAIAASQAEQSDERLWTLETPSASASAGSSAQASSVACTDAHTRALDDSAATIRADVAAVLPRPLLPHTSDGVDDGGIIGIGGLCVHSASGDRPQRSAGDEAREVIGLLLDLLKARDLTPSTVVQVHLYVACMANFAEINIEYKRVFSHNPPARVCVGCPLPHGRQLIMDVLVHSSPTKSMARGENETGDSSTASESALSSTISDTEFLHVQGMSFWAPANIGPYVNPSFQHI